MVTQSWLYDAIIYLYALSLLFYFSDFARANRSAKRMGAGLLVFVWAMQTLYLGISLYQHRVQWVFTMFETLLFFSWLLVGVSLVISRFFRIEMLVFFINVIGFAVLALNFFSNSQAVPTVRTWDMADELLFIHITLAIASYAAFAVAAVLSGMYLFLHRQLKEKQWTSAMKRLPSLEKIDRYTYSAVIAGTPLLILSLALGLVWITIEGNPMLFYDPKVVNSLFVLAAYGFYLMQRWTFRTTGKRSAVWNLGAFAFVVINFMVSNLISNFHAWIWM